MNKSIQNFKKIIMGFVLLFLASPEFNKVEAMFELNLENLANLGKGVMDRVSPVLRAGYDAAATTARWTTEKLGEAANAAIKSVNDRFDANDKKLTERRAKLDKKASSILANGTYEELDDYGRIRTIGNNSASVDDRKAMAQPFFDQIKEIDEELRRSREARDQAINEITKKGFDAFTDTYKTFKDTTAQFALEAAKNRMAQTTAMAVESVKGQYAVKSVQAAVDGIMKTLSDPTKAGTMAKYGSIFLGTSAFLGFGSYYGLGLLSKYIEANMGKPKLVQETSLKSPTEQLINYLLDKKEEKSRFAEIVVEPNLKLKLDEIFESYVSAIKNDGELFNCLAYGPPGTGKTMSVVAFVKKLNQELSKHVINGRKVEIHYMICSGADFSQYAAGKDIEEFYKIINFAKNSMKFAGLVDKAMGRKPTKRYLLWFIDECDSFVKNRMEPNISDKARNLTNAFLASFPKPSDPDIGIWFGTNYPDKIDSAVYNRISEKLEYKKPYGELLNNVFKHYFNKEVVSKKIKSDLTPAQVDELAQSLLGVSHRQVEEANKQLCRRLKFLKKNSVDIDVAKSVFLRFVEEERKQEERQKMFMNNNMAVAAA